MVVIQCVVQSTESVELTLQDLTSASMFSGTELIYPQPTLSSLVTNCSFSESFDVFFFCTVDDEFRKTENFHFGYLFLEYFSDTT